MKELLAAFVFACMFMLALKSCAGIVTAQEIEQVQITDSSPESHFLMIAEMAKLKVGECIKIPASTYTVTVCRMSNTYWTEWNLKDWRDE